MFSLWEKTVSHLQLNYLNYSFVQAKNELSFLFRRVYVLYEPHKESSSKSAESWSGLTSKVASLTLQSMEGAVAKYEEEVRSAREGRADVSWDFCQYFMLQVRTMGGRYTKVRK